VARRPGLGKGLDALIPGGLTETPSKASKGASSGPALLDIPIGDVVPNPHQPRAHFDEESLNDLTASIREIGVLQPLLVRRLDSGGYELIAGERRLRAAQRAGLLTVPVVVKVSDDLSSMEQALVENLHRQDLSPLEEASAFQQLIDDFGLTHDQVSKRVGKSRSSVSNALRILALPPAIHAFLTDGRLSAGHAKALLGTPDRAFQENIAKKAVAEGWSVRAVEEAVRDRGQEIASNQASGVSSGTRTSPNAGISKLRPAGLLELENHISDYLSTRVTVKMANKKGTITVEFADLEDLERLYYLMLGVNQAEG
jgi:ParB family chromosome partitioning protein